MFFVDRGSDSFRGNKFCSQLMSTFERVFFSFFIVVCILTIGPFGSYVVCNSKNAQLDRRLKVWLYNSKLSL